jgi:hypothetical protein
MPSRFLFIFLMEMNVNVMADMQLFNKKNRTAQHAVLFLRNH